MNCRETQELIHGFVDSELGLVGTWKWNAISTNVQAARELMKGFV